jgi:hypothetical protein
LIPLLPPDTQDSLCGEAGYPFHNRTFTCQIRATYLGAQLESMKVVRKYLNEKQLTYHTLPVKYGFHSSFIDPAASEFLSFMNKQTLKPHYPSLFPPQIDKILFNFSKV